MRRGDDDFLLVLVPGDREISWPKLRALLGVSRLSMPSADVAREATGYERGTITPFGSTTAWPISAFGPGVIRLKAQCPTISSEALTATAEMSFPARLRN